MKVGMAAGPVVPARRATATASCIGKDTRLSGYMIENALVAGFTAAGMDVFLLGPMPTPAVAMLTRSLRADLGVMISASHNPYDDNGIKLFGPDGYKLSDEIELQIEALIDTGRRAWRSPIRTASAAPSASTACMTATSNSPSARCRARCRWRACASSSIAPMAPPTRWRPPRCGNSAPRSSPIGVEPNGFNINQRMRLDRTRRRLPKKVHEVRADIGIALDGDADRVIIVDENGDVVDGDQLMAVIAESWHQTTAG